MPQCLIGILVKNLRPSFRIRIPAPAPHTHTRFAPLNEAVPIRTFQINSLSKSACPGGHVPLPSPCPTSQPLSALNSRRTRCLVIPGSKWGAGLWKSIPGQAVFFRSASQVVHRHLLDICGCLDVVGVRHQVRQT